MKKIKLYGNRIITGAGSVSSVEKLEGSRVFVIVGGQSVFKNGSLERLKTALVKGNKAVEVFSGVPKNPDVNIVLEGASAMKAFKPDTVIALGGGSPMDAAKVMALFYENPELDFETIEGQFLPQAFETIEFVAIPTTSGTGSEVTRAAVITFKEKNIKIGLKSKAFIPDIAILDPELTLSMPNHVVAETGMDALTHAIECYTNHNLDDFTECLAKGAILGLMEHLPKSYETGDLLHREKVHNYQCMAGMAFHNVGLGMSHGIAHAFGGQYDLGHGLLNAIALPHVMTYNAKDEAVSKKLAHLSAQLGVASITDEVKKMNKQLRIPMSLKEVGLKEEDFLKDFDILLDNSMKGSTRSNPVDIPREDMKTLLNTLYYGEA